MAASQVSVPKPICQLCEIIYDRNDHAPHIFPCQHTLCRSCLLARIENHTEDTRIHEQQLECPFCSQTTPLSDTLPVNRTLLDLLDHMQDVPRWETPANEHTHKDQGHHGVTRAMMTLTSHDEHAKDVMCPKHHEQVVCALCMQCMKGVCVTCLIKAKEHSGHEVLEFTEALNKCVDRSQTVLQDFVRACTAINDSITEKAQTKDLDCFTLLQKLQSISTEVTELLKAEPIDEQQHIRDGVPEAKAHSVEDQEEQEIASDPLPTEDSQCRQRHVSDAKATQAISLNLRALSTQQCLTPGNHINPDSVNTKIASLLASAHLPDFKHIDVNRRNKLLLVFPNAEHAIYKIDGSGFSKMCIPALCEESSCALKEADHIVLSDQNRIVIPSECFAMHNNTVQAFPNRYLSRILCVAKNLFIAAIEDESFTGELLNAIGHVTEYGMQIRLYECKLDSEYIFMPRDDISGVLVYSDGIVTIPTFRIGTCSNMLCSSTKVQLLPVPKAVVTGAAIGDKVLLVEKEKPRSISVYFLKGRWRTAEGNIVDKPYHEHSGQKLGVADNKLMNVSVKDLGLSDCCEIVRIWASDAPRRQRVLHVLYKPSVQNQEDTKQGHQQPHSLASYTLSQEFLDKFF